MILYLEDVILRILAVSSPEHPCWDVYCGELQSLSLAYPQQQTPIESFDVRT